jgi:hypothetical protein
MSDSELILRLLKEVERRTRGNRILNATATGFAMAMAIPVLFKILDLFISFRTTTVMIFFVVWGLATAGWLAWRVRGLKESLTGIAASIDKESQGHDQIKTAYWFIRNPQNSDWVNAQLQRAAANAKKIQIRSLYPRRLPRASFIAIGLILLLGVLNFLPVPWNYNWFYLQGAPAFSLTDADKSALQQALKLLQKADELNQTNDAKKLEEIIRAMQDGSMSKDQISKSLSELQQSLAERKLDAGRLTDGLERIAKALDPAQPTKPTAAEIFKLNLNDAAKEVRNLEKNVDSAPDSQRREMAERFQEAADNAGQGLEQIAQNMRETAEALRRGDNAASKQGLEKTAKELERLQRVLESQRLRSEASDQLGEVQESVGGTPGEVGGEGQESQGEGQGQGEGEGQGEGQGQGQGEGQGEGQGQGQGEGQGEGQGQGQGEGQGDGQGEGGDGQAGQGEGKGQGGKQAGIGGPLPMTGDPTSLETALEKEALPVRPTRGSRPETIEEASQRERSKLDYRNVPSNLTPAQKDALNQDGIPIEQRDLVKQFIESLRK